MKHLTRKLLMYIGCLLFSIPILAQDREVTGTITDNNGVPLPGVNVAVKGTSVGTQTNFDGDYALSVSEGDVLIFSFMGMQTVEKTVGVEDQIDVVMQNDNESLEEVVVVGYGEQKKSDVTGAIVSVSSVEINSRPVNNAIEAMQGKAAGVDITTSERPGTVGDITIRGVRSLTASNSPLYVVDGIPLISGGIENINPSDIESIDVLKDASSTAIYGSRGANGVVIVSTKRGKEGNYSLSLNSAVTFQTLENRSELMNASEYIEFRRWAKYYSDPDSFPRGDEPTQENDFDIFLGSADPYSWENILRGWEGGAWDGSQVRSTDWTDFVTRTGITNQHTLSVSGGSEKMTAYGSFGFLDNVGTVIGQSYRRYTGKVSIDIDATDWFSFGATINASYGVNEYGQSGAGRNSNVNGEGLYDTARGVFAWAVPYDDEGSRIEFPGGDDAVKTVIGEEKFSQDQRMNIRTFGSFYSEVDFSAFSSALDGLRYRMNFGPDISVGRDGIFLDAQSVIRAGSSYASLYKEQNLSYTLDNILFYDKEFGMHDIGLTFLQSRTQFKTEFNNMAADNIPFPSQKWNALSNTNVELNTWDSGIEERQLDSYMGRINYGYDERYILTLSGRYDGASQLAEGNKWAFFPSMALAWRFDRESFLENTDWLNQGKLRLGVGSTGNSAIDPYSTKGGLIPLFYPSGSTLSSGTITSTNFANKELGWETTTQYNVGVDFSLLNYRISGSLDYYNSKTDDLLLLKTLPTVTGYVDTYENVGKTASQGIDLTLQTVNLDLDKFGWESTLNASWQDNHIVELANGTEDDINNNWFIGEQLGVVYGYESNGIWQESDAEEIARFNANGHNFSPGLSRPVDQNGDYRIDANNDRTIIGNTLPKYILGLTNTFNYGNFELSVFMYGRFGYTYYTEGEAQTGRFNQRKIDYYTETNTNSKYQKPIYTAGTGDPFATTLGYESGSFIKIRNISLGYNFSSGFAKSIGLSNIRFYVQAQNPGMIFSDVDWVDLDVNSPSWNRGFTTGLNIDF